jgi:hypothetical protein
LIQEKNKKKVDIPENNEYLNKMKIIKQLKELSLQLAEGYESNLKIEFNIGVDVGSVKMNITEVNL